MGRAGAGPLAALRLVAFVGMTTRSVPPRLGRESHPGTSGGATRAVAERHGERCQVETWHRPPGDGSSAFCYGPRCGAPRGGCATMGNATSRPSRRRRRRPPRRRHVPPTHPVPSPAATEDGAPTTTCHPEQAKARRAGARRRTPWPKPAQACSQRRGPTECGVGARPTRATLGTGADSVVPANHARSAEEAHHRLGAEVLRRRCRPGHFSRTASSFAARSRKQCPGGHSRPLACGAAAPNDQAGDSALRARGRP